VDAQVFSEKKKILAAAELTLFIRILSILELWKRRKNKAYPCYVEFKTQNNVH